MDCADADEWPRGAASKWWLHKSLTELNKSLNEKLVILNGSAEDILPDLIKKTGATTALWNRCYEPWRISRDKKIKLLLGNAGITVKTFKDSVLWEPWEVLKSDNTPYKIFTPYYNNGCLKSPLQPGTPDNTKIPHSLFDDKSTLGNDISSLNLVPKIKWYKDFESEWTPGESGAKKALSTFLKKNLPHYKEGRDIPSNRSTSRLSPHLHFGEISIRSVWHEARKTGIEERQEHNMEHFCREIGWREFSTSLLYHFPDIPKNPLQKKFTAFPWDKNPTALKAWQKGETGIPIIDAGMRELWKTGYMHNRVRMIAASFLVKNLLIHWHEGEKWFWDCLLDADLANNSASWQWVAGCGTDAAPYFRIFNPITQGEKFDPNGTYVRTHVPELKNIPNRHIHRPWDSPIPPTNYPSPIIDIASSRERALEAFAQIK